VCQVSRPEWNSRFGKPEDFEVSPSPRISGIIELAGKLEIIHGAQALTGKILSRKELDPSPSLRISAAGSDARQTPQVRSFGLTPFYTATALVMICRGDCGGQGLGSHNAVIVRGRFDQSTGCPAPPSGESIEGSLKIAEGMEPPSPFVAPVVLNLKGGSSPIDPEVFNGSNVID